MMPQNWANLQSINHVESEIGVGLSRITIDFVMSLFKHDLASNKTFEER